MMVITCIILMQILNWVQIHPEGMANETCTREIVTELKQLLTRKLQARSQQSKDNNAGLQQEVKSMADKLKCRDQDNKKTHHGQIDFLLTSDDLTF